MDPLRNPFAPGAGNQPPELAGRDDVIAAATVAVKRVLAGRHDRSQMFLGLRGTGKTVLLNKIEAIGAEDKFYTTLLETSEKQSLADLLVPQIQQTLRKLSVATAARAAVSAAARAARNFAKAFKVKWGDVEMTVEAEPGVSDSGNLEHDLTDLFIRIGEACRTVGRGWMVLIDEVQYLDTHELSALIVALHKVSQRNLPVLFFGAGLPQVAALSGEAKSYSERLFQFPPIGPLSDDAAAQAIREPVEAEGEAIEDDAVLLIVERTHAYPYFLQEWGHQAWAAAASSPIKAADVERATPNALRRLDSGFFRVRFDQLTPKEREYVFAMASLDHSPYRSGDVARSMGETTRALGPCRAAIIRKGMIYMPANGDLAFTVPMFDDFLRRNHAEQLARFGG